MTEATKATLHIYTKAKGDQFFEVTSKEAQKIERQWGGHGKIRLRDNEGKLHEYNAQDILVMAYPYHG